MAWWQPFHLVQSQQIGLIAFRKGHQLCKGRVLHLIVWKGHTQIHQKDGAEMCSFVSQVSVAWNELLGHLRWSVNCSGKDHWFVALPLTVISMTGLRVTIFIHLKMEWNGKRPRLGISRTEHGPAQLWRSWVALSKQYHSFLLKFFHLYSSGDKTFFPLALMKIFKEITFYNK